MPTRSPSSPSRRSLLAALLTTFCTWSGPASAAGQRKPPQAAVDYMWSGGVTHDRARVNARLSVDGAKVRIVLADNTEFSMPKYSDETTAEWQKNGRSIAATFEGLKPATRYYYAVEIDGTADTGRRGTFRTFPEGPSSFTVVFGSCASTGSQSPVFDTIREHEPDLFMHIGDFHYENISTNDPDEYREAFGRVLSSPTQSQLYRSVPIDYTWDDHDWGPNDSDRTNPARRAAHRVYRETVPHYDLDGDESPLYHAFTIGRARFIVLDTRAARDPRGTVKATMLGLRQKQWLFDQLEEASKKHPLVFLVQGVPWIAATGKTGDGWASYCDERREIATRIEALGLTPRLVMLSGDAHMLAIDDGRHSNYATEGCGYSETAKGFPVFQAAAFDRMGSIKGGPYAPGFPRPGRGHFGLVTVTDTGTDVIRVQLSGRDRQDRELMGLDLKIPVATR